MNKYVLYRHITYIQGNGSGSSYQITLDPVPDPVSVLGARIRIQGTKYAKNKLFLMLIIRRYYD